MKTNIPENANDYHKVVTDYRSGNRVSKMLLQGKEGAPNNYRLNFSEVGGGSSGDWTTPRHRHTKEQFRYVLAGDYHLTDKEVVPAGWVAYFPESVYYGPQIKSKNLSMLTLQFGGASGGGHLSPRQTQKAIETLLARGGKFEHGIYTWIDEQGKRHNEDAAAATEAEAWGHKMEYPAPRYQDIIMMNVAAFSWVKDKENPGVARKNLGSFTERDTRYGFVQMEKGATLKFGTEKAPEILFLKEGVLTHENTQYIKRTAFSTEENESPVELKAVEPSELVYIKLPTF